MFRLLFCVGTLLFGLGSARAANPAVQLFFESRQVAPHSSFEVRFSAEMVAPAQIGTQPSPLIFTPALEGEFTWLSTRSGSFTPSQVPPLDTTFAIQLRPGLTDAQGRAVEMTLAEKVFTPPMRIKGLYAEGNSDGDASAKPSISVLFNANVEAGAAAPFFVFTNGEGARIEAKVKALESAEGFRAWESEDHSLLTWRECFAESENTTEPVQSVALPRRNALLIEPVTPLAPGTKWKLVIGKGVPSSDEKAQLREGREVMIGTVKPFTVSKVSADSGRHSGRVITVQFSKDLNAQLKPETLLSSLRVEPAVPNLKAEMEGDTVALWGGFELGKSYQVTVEAGLAAEEPFTLNEKVSRTVTFEPIAPRLYFEEFVTHQLLTGSRHFRLANINVPKVRITATQFKDAAEVARALKAYEKYRSPEDDKMPEGEEYQRIDPAKLGGKTIWKSDFGNAAAPDQMQSLALDWDDILGVNKGGAVLLTAESTEPVSPSARRCGTQALVQVSDLGVAWKSGTTGAFVHVFSLTNGKANPGAKVRLLDAKQKPVSQSVTDAQGGAVFSRAERQMARWLWVEHAGDTHLVDLEDNRETLPIYRMGLGDSAYGFYDDGQAGGVFLLSERGVYQPGETLHLKGIARDLSSGERPKVPAGQKLTLTLKDARDREVLSKEVVLSDFGSFAEDIVLPKETLGRYTVRAESAKEDATALGGTLDFEVQQYRPNAFEVLIAEPPAALGAAAIQVPVNARYLMGKTLSKAKMTWSLVARDSAFEPAGMTEAFVFCDGINNYRLNKALDRLSQFNSQGEVELHSDGSAAVASAFPINAKAPQPRAAKLLCEVTDLNQDTVSDSRDFTRHASEFYFGLRRLKPLLKADETLPIELIAVRAADGQPLQTPVHASLRLTRVEWQTNRMEGAGAAAEFESKPIYSPVWSGETDSVPFSKERAPLLLANAPVLKEPGLYLLEARGTDSGGREVLTSVSFYVAGKGQTVWDYSNPYVIDLVANKASYEPGQTAQILIKTPIAGEALVTVERENVRRSFTVPLSGNSPTIPIQLTEGDAPNVFVSVLILRGADQSPRKLKAPEYRVGYCQLKVERPADKLGVSVTASRPNYRPGDSVEVEARVVDFSGKPLADAEVILYAVDEGILSLTGYKTPDPLAFFNAPRHLRVESHLTLPSLLNEELNEADFANKGYLVGDGKGGGNGNNGLRKNFLPCAFWNATLRTDAAGGVRASFVAPDSLTRYRIIAVAQTRASQFGGGESAFEINKPFMVEPALPRFANVGDKLSLRAVLHNTSQLAGTAEVTLELDGVAKAEGPSTRSIAVPAGASVALDFPVQFTATGHGVWRWKGALTSADGKATLRDAVKSELNVGYPAPLVREVHTGRVEAAEGDLLTLEDPQILESKKAEVNVRLSNTRAVELGEALRQVLHYPYGCVEQTTSAMLPWLLVGDLQGALPQMARPKNEIADAVNHGITQLFSMQTDSGGLGYWPGATRPMLWGSAYGGLGLALAQKQGFAVPEEEFNRLLKFLSEQLRGASKESNQFTERCLALYTLAVAGKAEPAYHELIFKKRASLNAEDRAVLALAMIESHGPRAMIEELLAEPPTDEAYVEAWFGSESRNDAIQLLARTLEDPKSPKIDELATELLRKRTRGHWSTTQSNAWALMALATYLREIERGSGAQNVTGEVRWAARKETFALSKTEKIFSTNFALEAASAKEPLHLTRTGGDRVYSEVTVEAQPPLTKLPAQDRGFSIERRYAKVADDGSLKDAKELRVGDRVLISLSIEVRRRSTYVAVEDPLPAVFAAINPAFKTQQNDAAKRVGTDWISDHSELREDRAVFFADTLRAGHYTLRYLARVVAAGSALAPAAKIEEMYHPERFGNSGTLQIETRALEEK